MKAALPLANWLATAFDHSSKIKSSGCNCDIKLQVVTGCNCVCTINNTGTSNPRQHINALVQNYSNSIANALDLLQSYNKPFMDILSEMICELLTIDLMPPHFGI